MSKQKIIGELCTCGHLKTHHLNIAFPPGTIGEDRIVKDLGTQQRAKHHGACSMCNCPQFTWKEYVYEEVK